MEFFFEPLLGKPFWMWALFVMLVLGLLVLDLGILHRKTREISAKESLLMSAFYIGIAAAFGVWIWISLGEQAGTEFFTGFLIEKTLSLDNIFLISLVFTYFSIPPQYQHRVLFWGILGVIVLRAIMIALGAALVSNFGWVLYLFAAFLILTGMKMLFMEEQKKDIEKNPLLRLMRKTMRITNELHGENFYVAKKDPKTGRLVTFFTPLFVALALIEIIDLIFAIDSVPAIFAITSDPFIVYTSNIFAILGLRALYFALAVFIERFRYLKQALALVLIFIGSKIFIADLMGWGKFPPLLSLQITIGLITSGILYSLYKTRSDVANKRH
ncbi:MAG: TerC family protein [Hyphomicrobium sp.]